MADKPKYQKRVSYQSALLGGFATLSAMFLLMGDITTRDAIAQRKAEDMQASLQQVVRQELHTNNLLDDQLSIEYQDETINVYRGTHEGEVTALAFEVSDYGYGGEINLLMAINPQGKILGVRVLSHTETPGLGDKMEIEKSPWILSFNGLSLHNTDSSEWAVKKDGGKFDQFTGATITPRGIVRAVKSGLDFFQANKEQLTQLVAEQPASPPDANPTVSAQGDKANES